MKKQILSLGAIFTATVVSTKQTFAAVNNDIFGEIKAPVGVEEYNTGSGAVAGFGALVFFSNMIKVATVGAGIFVMVNFIMAGYIYITSAGDTGAHKKVSDKITMSIIGLVLIVSAYTIAGLIGLILFGDASYILSPTVQGPT